MSKASSSKKKKPASTPTIDLRPEGSQTTRTMAVDIGGSGVKTMLLDEAGKPLTERLRAKTPNPSTPKAITKIIVDFAKQLGDFERVSVGFPGVIKKGTVYTAANLNKKWIEYPFAENLSKALDKPVRVANDAVVQGLGAVTGAGVELVITLGTGMGSALYLDGCPFRRWSWRIIRSAMERLTKTNWDGAPSISMAARDGTSISARPSPNCTNCFITTGSTSAAGMPLRSRSSSPVTPARYPTRTACWAALSCGIAIWRI